MKKKILIIVIGLTATIWLLILPGVVGLILKQQVSDWLADSAPTAESRFDAGWFSSRLALTDTHLAANLQARHFPATRPGWLSLTGTVELPQLTAPGRLNGFLHLDGHTRFALDAAELIIAGSPRTTLNTVTVRFEQDPSGETGLEVSAANVHLAGTDTMGLDYPSLDGDLVRKRLDETTTRLALNLILGNASDPESLALAMTAGPIDDGALEELLSGIGQLRSARPDTFDEQLALLTLAGAWQRLTEAGLIIELEHLELGPETRLTGRWSTASGLPRMAGRGDAETLLEFLSRMVGLARSLPAAAAEREARAWLTSLVDRGWLTIEGSRFRFAYPSASEDESSSATRP